MVHKRSMELGGITNLSVLAPIKAGMVIGFEPISYLERLRKVLDALQSSRQNVRESELRPPMFPDVISRFGIIHHFRYAIVPPVPGAREQPVDGTWHLSLNVTFDGGWEPYMRVIYRGLGTLLDLLFCHCDGYPGSRTSRFEDYCAWVRDNEVEGGIFYADSAMTVGDQQYLAAVERMTREGADPSAADHEIARLGLPSDARRQREAMAQAMADPNTALVLPLRTLKGLYRLSTYFPSNGAENEMGVLRRFAQRLLEGPRRLMAALDAMQPVPPAWATTRALLADELDWLRGSGADADVPPPAIAYDPAKLQAHILGSGSPATHGCVAMLRIADKQRATQHFARLAAKCKPVAGGEVGYTVAFTHAGLEELDIAGPRLDALPQEFVDGMEARCALLGDVRGNHPDRWSRPAAFDGSGHLIDMKVVHAVVLLHLADDANPSHELHSRLAQEVEALQQAGTGLRVLAVQPTRSYRVAGSPLSTGHFGFADGISQPRISTEPRPPAPGTHTDDVRPGELLLGHANDRGDPPNPAIDPLLFNGSFLVIRKLRQRVDHLDTTLQGLAQAQRDELLSKMMGRHHDGTPLVPQPQGAGLNDFTYDQAAASNACPFQSHIRRANPRDGRPYMPRIVRRGMSYGPKSSEDLTTERGVVFMAYCASIAEQFETIQRWIAGGNSSGVGSSQGDPFLRVPQQGESNTFRYLDAAGQVKRVVFDDQPLVQLEWGLYLFVPALEALAKLAEFQTDPPEDVVPPRLPVYETDEQKQEKEREGVRQLLDDHERAVGAWKRVREGDAGAPQDTAYGHLVGTYQEVLDIMKDGGQRYSVQGYGKRMDQSIGLNLLGMDGPAHTQQLPLNEAVASIGEEAAFDLTAQVVERVLAQFPPLPANAGEAQRRPIDLISFSDHVMAALCTAWIGLPDKPADGQPPFMVAGGRLEDNPGKPRCPGNFATASRFIFSPHPRDPVQEAGRAQGQSVLQAVQGWLQSGPRLGILAEEIRSRLNVAASHPSLALSLAGVLLGFPPTVQGNYLRTMETWIKDQTLWQHQQALFEATAGAAPTYGRVNQALRGRLLATMRQRPVPEMLWRSPVVKDDMVDFAPGHRVVLGIASALTDEAAPDSLMFGRDDRTDKKQTVHGCPGYPMAMGVMLAMMAGLMNAGTLRPTGSPVQLMLTPR
jgi:Dyp-type peroxidase family